LGQALRPAQVYRQPPRPRGWSAASRETTCAFRLSRTLNSSAELGTSFAEECQTGEARVQALALLKRPHVVKKFLGLDFKKST
jgi:hypothetical protein